MERELEHKSCLCGENFLIKIHFQDNFTWQGTIHWLNGRKNHTFRSLLEMVSLLQEAVNSDSIEAPALHSWEVVAKGCGALTKLVT